MARKRSGGFTLVELLVVLGVISLLAGMLLPAVQSAREAARLTSCRNHISQLSKGLIQHESLLQYFPSGGWGPQWLGVAERSNDSSQPGGWIFSVLPYIEEKALRNTVAGVTGASVGSAYTKLVSTALPLFTCPSRRSARPLYVPSSIPAFSGAGDCSVNPAVASRSDFAINSGATGACVPVATYKGVFHALTASVHNSKKVSLCHKGKTQSIGLPAVSSAGHADDTLGACEACDGPLDASNLQHFTSLSTGDTWRKLSPKDKVLNDLADMGIPDMQDGISFRMSRLQAASVFDGLSNTYLIGEKYVTAGTYDLGSADGDSRPMMVGYSSDNVRWGFEAPHKDMRQTLPQAAAIFGSAHAGGWNAAYADGAVRTVTFNIDADLHRLLSTRDGISQGKMAGMPPQ
jgi:prepilin-type N-terminal cleavage/methylation domain-containing protein